MISEGSDFTDYVSDMENFTEAFQIHCGLDEDSRVSLYSLSVEDVNLIYEEYAKWHFDNPNCQIKDIDSSYFEELKGKLNLGE